jgi:hypothetical protein
MPHVLNIGIVEQVLPIIKWSTQQRIDRKGVGMVISVVIGCLDFDKRKGLMSLLEGKNDVFRCNRWQRDKFKVNVAWTMFHDAS